MTGEQKPGGLEVVLSAAMARAICENEGKEWMALDNTRADVERWLRLGEITAEPAEARIRELEELLEQAGRYQAEFRDRATAAEAKLARAVELIEVSGHRLGRLALECAHGSRIRDEANEWAEQCRQTLAALQQGNTDQ